LIERERAELERRVRRYRPRPSRGPGNVYAAAVEASSGPAAPLLVGKAPASLLAEILAGLPTPPTDVLIGPRVGEDAGAIGVPRGVLVAATDPITFTAQDIGRFSVIVNANDIAVMGVRPRWFLAVILLPPGSTERTLREIFASMQEGLSSVGATLIGGHTEVTQAVRQPVVVGQTLGVASGRVISSGGVRPGDVLVQVGPVPIEGAAVLAREAADDLGAVDPGIRGDALGALDDPGISVVEAALLAAELGADAMHDPTEGGLAAGLHELADASRVRLRVDVAAVRWFESGLAVCRALSADPLATLASGALLASFPADRAQLAVRALARHGHVVSEIGHAEEGSGVWDAEDRRLPWPERDEVARLLSPA
jgi:hydrogenase expression/formation protein HypE